MPRLLPRPALAGPACARLCAGLCARLCACLCVCLLLAGCADHRGAALRPGVTAAGILRGWDARRADAWAADSVTDLRALYAPGSATGAADVRMLRAWRSRGLVVEHLATQLLSVEVLTRAPGMLRLRVTDRVVRAEAVGPPLTGERVDLPRDRPSTYVIVLERYDDAWLVREATAA